MTLREFAHSKEHIPDTHCICSDALCYVNRLDNERITARKAQTGDLMLVFAAVAMELVNRRADGIFSLFDATDDYLDAAYDALDAQKVGLN